MNIKILLQRTLGSVLCLTLMTAMVFVSCEEIDDRNTIGDTQPPKEDVLPENIYPLVITDGKARFYLAELPNSVRSLYGKTITNWADYTVKVNGVTYPVRLDSEKRYYVDVVESSTYNAVLLSSKSSNYHGQNEYTDVVHPHSYAYHNAKDVINHLPHFASYSENTGGMFFFSSALSLLEVTVKGSASLSSIKVENPAGNIAGYGTFDTSSNTYTVSEGLPYVVLNCTNKGSFVPVTQDGVKLLIPIAAGSYASGLDLTICDSDHKMATAHIPAFTVSSDKVHKCTVTYKPASDLLFYEGFDNFVWGGDVVGGSGTFGAIPKDETVSTSSFRSLTGYEAPLYKTSYDMPGAGYIQPDEGIANLRGFKVKDKMNLSASYARSRNIESFDMLYHCQEFQGYISVGATGATNGLFQAPFAKNIIRSYCDVKVKFDYCPMAGFEDDLMLQTVNGANILSCTIDGKDATATQFTRSFEKTSTTAYLLNAAVPVPTSAAAKKTWHHVELVINNMNEISSLSLTTRRSETGKRGFYLDNFEVRTVDAHTKTTFTKTLRVMFWNIQYGMWADQKNNYDNFVACVNKYRPDVCVWCEAESYYDNNGNTTYRGEKGPSTGVGSLKGYGNLTGWKWLAGRYGHENVSGSDNTNTNFPQIITSRYPITRVMGLSSSQTGGHPAGLYKINCGEDVYLLSMHLTPGLTDAANDTQRLNEIKKFCQYIIPYQAGNFLMMGDFNTVSPHDKWYYDGHKYPNMTSDPYQALRYLHDNTTLKDVIHESYPGDFLSSVREDTQRIDYMYASPKMMQRLKTADIMIDEWIKLEIGPLEGQYLCVPSDHRPIIADYSFE